MQPKPVQKTIGGLSYEDRFAHLLDENDEVLAWQWEHDAVAQRVAQGSPNYAPVRDRILAMTSGEGIFSVRQRGPYWFTLEIVEGDMLLRFSDAPGAERLTIMSKRNAIVKAGATDALILMFEPSPDGRFVAACIGFDGNPMARWQVYETATGRHVTDSSPVFNGLARPAWTPESKGFWLNDRTAEGNPRLQFVPVAEDATAQPDILPPADLVSPLLAAVTLHIAPGGRRALAVSEYTGNVACALIDLSSFTITPFLPEGFDGDCCGTWLDDETYIARITDDAPAGRVVAIPVATSRDKSSWRDLVPEGEGIMEWAGVVAGHLYVGDQIDVSLRVRVFDLDGKLLQTMPLERPGSSVSMMLDRTVRPAETFAFSHTTFARSPSVVYHDPVSGEVREFDQATIRLDHITAEQRFATSRDGTRISYFLVYRKDLDLRRPQPVLVQAYAGFNTALQPALSPPHIPFVEAGGIYVQPALRGGAEYGKAWHEAGRREKKANTFDDLRAVAEALIAEGVSTPDQMAFQGNSNGGLLAGVAITHMPHLWRVVAPVVPLFDMLEAVPNGAAAVQAVFKEEFGDPEKNEVAAELFGWSPYHAIKDGTAYPAVFTVSGELDHNCAPFHSRKFYARLSEANSGERPIYMRVFRDTGHIVIDPEKSALFHAEWLSFVMDQVGLRATAPG